MKQLQLTKYEALGNDFLVAVSPEETIDPATVVALCDRHRGIGADGLIELREHGSSVVMRLTNADGSSAETSGNGLRCAGLACFDHELAAGTSVWIETDAGLRQIDLISGGDGSGELRAEMGIVSVAPVQSPLEGRQAFSADVGNPHLVLLGEQVDDVDLAQIGPELEAARPGGQNVEFIALSGSDELELIVFERGAGITEACGSGSCAAAAAARLAGVAGDHVLVDNPGGRLTVDMDGPAGAPRSWLTGPARRVGEVVVRVRDLDRRLSVGIAPAPR